MQMNALRSANFAKLSSSNSTSDEYWVTSISDGTPAGYCLSQMRSMGLSPQYSRICCMRCRLGGPDRLVSASIGNAAADGKRLRLTDALGGPCANEVNGSETAPTADRACAVNWPAW